jgi:Zn-dependent protease with chaperone function
MDFFARQEEARAASRRLIVLFLLAVLAVAAAVGTVAYLGCLLADRSPNDLDLPLAASGLTLLVIGTGSFWETRSLRLGGEAVAAKVGAREIGPQDATQDEQRLLNVVDEMALAAGVAVPRTYVMEDESAPNAFAAGHTVDDAVIVVTRGLLETLARDELQAVVAHEFSHILHGDMRLNLRMVGVLAGLTLVAKAGQSLMQAGRGRRRGGMPALAAGAAVWLAGSMGVLCGRLIRAAVSRHREFLADASAVQFTRNPMGLASALRKVATEPITHPGAEAIAHLFIAAPLRRLASGWLATHPPIAERIRRLGAAAAAPAPTQISLSADPERAPDAQLSPDQVLALFNRGATVGNDELAMLDRAMPALRRLPAASVTALLGGIRQRIDADGKTSLEEGLLYSLLHRRLDRSARRSALPAYRSVAELAGDASRVLSLLAWLQASATPPEDAMARARSHLQGVALTLLPRQQLTVITTERSLQRLDQLFPMAKPAFLAACAGIVPRDAVAYRLVALSLEAPLQPFTR